MQDLALGDPGVVDAPRLRDRRLLLVGQRALDGASLLVLLTEALHRELVCGLRCVVRHARHSHYATTFWGRPSRNAITLSTTPALRRSIPSGVWSALCGRQDDLLAGEQGMARRQRLGVEHVERRAGQAAGVERVDQGVGVDDGPRAVLTRMAPGFISPSSRGPRRPRLSAVSRTWTRHDVGRPQELVERHVADAQRRRPRRRRVEGPGQDVHADRAGQPGHRPADRPGPDQAERLAAEVDVVHARPAPRLRAPRSGSGRAWRPRASGRTRARRRSARSCRGCCTRRCPARARRPGRRRPCRSRRPWPSGAAAARASASRGHLIAPRVFTRQTASRARASFSSAVAGPVGVEPHLAVPAEAVEVRRALDLRGVVAGDDDDDVVAGGYS